VRIRLVVDQVQDRDQHDRYWLRSPGLPGTLEDRLDVAEVGVEIGRRALSAAGQQRTRVGKHDRMLST
jgi:hypothetical protein